MASPLTTVIAITSEVSSLAQALAVGTSGPWHPPQWAQQNASKTTLTLTSTNSQNVTTVYVFDAILRAEHEQNTVITQNPVQTGASLTDHAYNEPARITFELFVSDVMRSFTVGQFADAPSRSVSAYQTLLALQTANPPRPLQIATRLNHYSNMLITNIRAIETKDTRFALRAIVTCQQILTAKVEATHSTLVSTSDPSDSEIPQATNQSMVGQVQTFPVPAAVQAQNNIANAPASANVAQIPQVSGAGNWSSYNVSGLSKILAP